jgi:phosphoglycolate phosphatase-like HAD superfamily hydrolase
MHGREWCRTLAQGLYTVRRGSGIQPGAHILMDGGLIAQSLDSLAGMSRALGAIVFDMDGTLFDSKAVVPDSYIAAIQKLGGPVYEREQIVASYPVGPPKAMMGNLLGRECADEDLDDYYDILTERAADVQIYTGIPEALAGLSAGLQLAVYSGASTRACRILLEATNLAGFFRVVVGADEVAQPKPSPDGILETCRRLGVDAGASAYVGDAPYDLEAARRSAALAVAAAWGHMYRPDEPADVVVRRPADLLSLIGPPPS